MRNIGHSLALRWSPFAPISSEVRMEAYRIDPGGCPSNQKRMRIVVASTCMHFLMYSSTYLSILAHRSPATLGIIKVR